MSEAVMKERQALDAELDELIPQIDPAPDGQLQRRLERIHDYLSDALERADPADASLHAMRAGAMRVSTAMEELIVRCLSSPRSPTTHRLEEARLSVNSYSGLLKMIRQLESPGRPDASRRGPARPVQPEEGPVSGDQAAQRQLPAR